MRDLLACVLHHWPEMREVSADGQEAHEGPGEDSKYRHVISAYGTPENPSPFSATRLTTAASSPVSVIAPLEDASPDLVSFCGDAVALLTVASQWSLNRLLDSHKTEEEREHEEGGTTFEHVHKHPWLRIMADAAPKAFHRAAHCKHPSPKSHSQLRLLCLDAHATATYMRWARPVCFIVSVDEYSMDPVCVGPPLVDLRFPVTSAMHLRVLEAALDSARYEQMARTLPLAQPPHPRHESSDTRQQPQPRQRVFIDLDREEMQSASQSQSTSSEAVMERKTPDRACPRASRQTNRDGDSIVQTKRHHLQTPPSSSLASHPRVDPKRAPSPPHSPPESQSCM